MIASLHGKLIFKDISSAVIECGGVGMKCAITQNTYSHIGAVGEDVFLYTHLAVREDALDLYGFSTEAELHVFKLITGVSGVGPKIGISILSQFTADRVLLYIASSDAKALTAASGVGLKLAQRIVLELKDKAGTVAADEQIADLKAVTNASENSASKEAIEALVSLGYSQSEAALAVGKLGASLSVDEYIKQALRLLARGI